MSSRSLRACALPQRDGAYGEGVVAVVAFGQRLQIGEQRDGGGGSAGFRV